MAGSINIRDANEVDLLDGMTLTANDTGTSVELDADATEVTFVLDITAAGTITEGTIYLEVSSDNFATDTRGLGAFLPISEADNATTRNLNLFIPGYPGVGSGQVTGQLNEGGARWVRAQLILAGTSPDLTGSTMFTRIAKFGYNDPTLSA